MQEKWISIERRQRQLNKFYTFFVLQGILYTSLYIWASLGIIFYFSYDIDTCLISYYDIEMKIVFHMIERTFLKPHNTNAHLHLVRTRRPWYQFLNHCDALCLGRVIESLSAIQYLSKTWWFLLGCYWNTSYTLSLLGRISSSFEMLITTEMFDLFSIVHIHVLISFLLQIFV